MAGSKSVICPYWSFLDFRQKIPYLIQQTMSFNDDEIVCVTSNGYRIYFLYVSKDEVINFLRNYGLTVKSGTL